MTYRLRRQVENAAPVLVAETALPNAAVALEWAVAWLEDKASDEDFWLEDASGAFAARFVRTAGNRWYAIAQPPQRP